MFHEEMNALELVGELAIKNFSEYPNTRMVQQIQGIT
jgi:hypothetical protein